MGSRNDYTVMRAAVDVLREFNVPHEVRVVSAHRTPDLMFQYAETAAARGLRVIIAGAGGAAHLPGMIAAKTVVPVLGVPISATALQGFDALLSIVQMPKGIPVGTLAIGASGAMNAGLLAVQVLATTDPVLASRPSSSHGAPHAATKSSPRQVVVKTRTTRSPRERGRSYAPTLLPGATIGIFGGGQLGRLDPAMAARSMWAIASTCSTPTPGCPARFVVDQMRRGRLGPIAAEAAASSARGCDVITLEIVNRSPPPAWTPRQASRPYAPAAQCSPSSRTASSRRTGCCAMDFPVGSYCVMRSLDELRAAVTALGGKCFCKSATGGYDGRGQGKVGFALELSCAQSTGR